MLVIVLVLVLAAFALLLIALLGSSTLWAWLSVAVSLVAAVLLTVDWWRRRRAAKAAETAYWDGLSGVGPPAEPDEPATARNGDAEPGESGAATGSEPTEPAEAAAKSESAGESDAASDADAEPDEEQTDAADVLLVSELDAEVVVVDERPRYHLAACNWLAGRPTLTLPAWEARELGFTPCAVCGPDRKLAAQHRRRRAQTQSQAPADQPKE